MKKELQYFKIEGAWGGSQEWFSDRMMRLGGCAAVTACDVFSLICTEEQTCILLTGRKSQKQNICNLE